MTALTDRLRNWLGTSQSQTNGLGLNAMPHAASPSKVSNHNACALDLYQRLHAGSNLVFSPFSIRLALSMTRAGAVGETAAQMAVPAPVHPRFGTGESAPGARRHGYAAAIRARKGGFLCHQRIRTSSRAVAVHFSGASQSVRASERRGDRSGRSHRYRDADVRRCNAEAASDSDSSRGPSLSVRDSPSSEWGVPVRWPVTNPVQ
jgi:hypothetical protein